MAAIFLTALISYITASLSGIAPVFFVTFFALVVFNIEILSLFKGINGLNILLLTLGETLLALIIWTKNKKPFLKMPSFFEIKKALLEDRALLTLAVVWLFCMAISFILAGFSPVNEPDAQGYHALRALFWAKDGFISHFETADVRCHSMPVNSELFYVWLLALLKKDCCFGLLQFFSYFLLIISSFKIMEGIEVKKKLWAVLIFTSLPGVISQISSTQTDLTTGALLVSSMVFIKEYKKTPAALFFGALSTALSWGVKSTGVIASIPLLIYFAFILKRDFYKFSILLVFNFLIFSSYNYFLNFINYGNFLGAQSAILGHGFWGGIKAVIANFIRYIFQFFDFSGFTIGFYLNDFLQKAQNCLMSAFSIPPGLGENVGLSYTNVGMTEQTIGFGVLGFSVFLPCAVVALFKRGFRPAALIFWAQILILSASVAYMVYSVRFLVTFISIALPVFCLSYFKKMNILKFFMVLFAAFYLGYASLFLSQRPFFHIQKEFLKTKNLNEIQNRMRDLNYKFYPSFNEALTLKNAVLPLCRSKSRIGISVSNGYMLYSAKYLELLLPCAIDTPNLLHEVDFESYDFLITSSDLTQHVETITKNDILNPKAPDFKTICYFEGFDAKRNPRLLSRGEENEALGAICALNKSYLEKIGFTPVLNIHADLPEYLKKRKDETIGDLTVWKNR